MQTETKTCQNCKQSFTIEPDDFGFYERMQVPPPTFCPDCRFQRRILGWNDRTLYKISCALCGKAEISMFEQGKPYTVYCPTCWHSDKWDISATARGYDFSKPFFKQFAELMRAVPVRSRFFIDGTLVNSDYTNLVGNLKNCYLVYNSDYNENCYYGTEIERSKDCFDNTLIDQSELCYSVWNCDKSSKVFFSTIVEDSHDIWFSKNISGCSNCFGCLNLRKKQYHIFNKPYGKEEYEQEIKKLYDGSYESVQKLLQKRQEMSLNFPMKYMLEKHNTNVTGDSITYSKDVHKSFIVIGAQNCKYCHWLIAAPTKDAWDYTAYGDNAELMYEATGGDNISNIRFGDIITKNSYNLTYCIDCHSSSNLFGCYGIRRKSYCILNKQYSKEDYEGLVPKIIEHMNKMPYRDGKGREYKFGEYFPIELARFAYNETIAQEYFPLTKEQALEQGYQWKDFEEKQYQPTKKWSELPQTIAQADVSLLNEVILCQAWDEDSKRAQEHNCTKAFRLTKQEFEFYKRFNVPLPRRCPNTRHFDRGAMRNPFKLWERACMCGNPSMNGQQYTNLAEHFHGNQACPNKFETSYAPERKEIVYCGECYQAEVV